MARRQPKVHTIWQDIDDITVTFLPDREQRHELNDQILELIVEAKND